MGLFTQEEFNDIQRSLEAMTNWFNNKMTKTDNNAPKSIKGDYDLSIHGNKIVLVDNVDGTTVEAKCHPDDDFDISIGITEAFKKLNEKREEIRKAKEEEEKKIKVGDWVEVVDEGEIYPFYYQWLPSERFDLVKNFAYGNTIHNRKCKVMYIGRHENEDVKLGYIQDSDGLCHTYKINALRKVANPDA